MTRDYKFEHMLETSEKVIDSLQYTKNYPLILEEEKGKAVYKYIQYLKKRIRDLNNSNEKMIDACKTITSLGRLPSSNDVIG